ncbi:hypothetical protein BGZ63DRAFT_417478 [Mariannaea sp. PMI_226]|nr:hypothetical protein BGZ63DRAFT_417478 [Mariannaea sp. PMI_226]
MATEAAVDKAADAPATESQLAPDAQNVVLDRSSVTSSPGIDEIENKRITSVDDQINSADVSVSGGSDTEASRADGSKGKDGDRGHGRTGSSVKKPATFKAVSVNKTFLAAKANATSASAKVVEKQNTGSSTPPLGQAALSSRPRLVAKTGSGVRDSSPRFSASANGKPGSAPDPSVVWNKNRPAPPPEPKKFTDEELKKYGIHMASRLNEDDAQGQNKWADIDDDDDDWAPEAITWGDGTKITLPHHEEPPPAPPSDNGSVASKGKLAEKPRSPAPPASVGSPLPKSSGLASGKGLVLKSGSQDKPTLVAKPPQPPAPVKSPWATLPPVEKASPCAPEPAQLVRGVIRDHLAVKGMAPPKEIAADDFSRAGWREGGAHGNRELYNPSGRHEFGPDRRGSMRMEQHPRHHPSLLQRPPPSQSDYPEPSGAFQTSRVSQEPPFGRRRGSSNVSGGSGSFMRMNKAHEGSMQPPEHLSARRTSFAGSVDSPVSPGNLSVSAQGPPRQSGWMPRASPRAAFATPQQVGPAPETVAGPPPPVQPMVDEVEFQKKLMRERNELARKRRQEEDAREEAERRERIQKKLDALGPAPEKKSDKKEAPPSKQGEESQPTQIQQREGGISSSQGTSQPLQEENKSTGAITDETSAATKTSPSIDSGPPPPRRVSQSQEPKPTDLWGAASASRQERFTSWTAGSQAASRNVWGSPNNDRGLGNGTFITDLGHVPTDVGAAAQGGKGPTPIGPPNSSRQPSQGRPQPPAPIGSRVSRYAPTGNELASKWVASVAENDKKMATARMTERTDRERQLAERGLTMDDTQPIIKETWRPVHAPGDGTRRPVGSSETQSHRPGGWRGPGEDAVRSPPTRGSVPSGSHDGVMGLGSANVAVPPQDDAQTGANAGIIGGPNSSILSQNSKGANFQGRPSRFFPMKDARHDNSAPVDSRCKSPTPPPPTMEGHPAYEGDVMRPHVSLPKPQPIVKLPPSMTSSHPPQSRSQFGWSNPPTSKDSRQPLNSQRPKSSGEATQETWQNRINSLLNGSRSPPQRSIVVDPASKSALDHVTHEDAATVSLPGSSPAVRPTPSHGDVKKTQLVLISKPMAEECFEEQEMGSLPQIRLPHKAPEAAWLPALAQTKPLPKRFWVQPAVMEAYYFPADVVGGGNAMKIYFPGMTEAKIVTVPFSATRGGRGSHTRSSPRHRGTGHERRGGKRDTSSSRASSTRGEHGTSSGRGGRGSYRNRGGDTWSRASATPPSLST